MTAMEREPCPDRILDDAGSAFAMGAVGGTIFHFLKGMKNSPRGHRLSGGGQAVRMSAPRTAGSFAVWGFLYSTFDCAMVHARQKEDPWNSILAGAATGGFLNLRRGVRFSAQSALVGAGLLALIEGAGIMINRVVTCPQDLPPFPGEDPVPLPGLPAPVGFLGFPQVAPDVQEVSAPEPSSGGGAGGWFGRLFGRKEEKSSSAGGGGDRKSEMLESFDTPSSPIPSFEYK